MSSSSTTRTYAEPTVVIPGRTSRQWTRPCGATSGHATLEPAVGGAFELDINGVPIRGRYLEIDPPRRVVVSWGVAGNTELPPGATQVEFTLTPTPAGTHLRLVHSGLPPSQAPMHATGWNHFLPRLTLAAAGTDPGPDPWNQAS